MPAIVCMANTSDVLGEVPIWSVREQALYWIDAFKPGLHRYDAKTGAVTSRTPPVKLGSFALRAGGGFLLASRSGLGTYDPSSGRFDLIHDPEADRPNNLLNDGRCDRRGRFWVGSMDRMIQQPSARLYRFDPDHSCRVMQDEIYLSNGIAFSPDDRTMYFADSHHKAIYRYDFDLDAGTIANRRVFATVEHGVPDGACVDTDGCLWSVQFHASRVVRYTPDGTIDRTIELPVTQPTACTFGGADLKTLFVTTAGLRLTDAQRAAQPHAGGLLAIDAGAQGLEEPLFGG